MLITFQGLILLIACLYLLYRRPPMQMLCVLLWLGVFQGTAAVILTALGGSSIAPQRLAIAFLLVQLAVVIRFRSRILRDALVDNAGLVLFCGWGVASAVLLPRVFAGTMRVVPLNPFGQTYTLLATVPLRATSQNLTTAFYLMGTALAGVLAHIVVRMAGTAAPLVRTALVIGATQLTAALLNLGLPASVWHVISGLVRNGSYAQLEQNIDGMARISGFQPETSMFAGYTFIWLVCCCELWLRHISPRLTGPCALALLMITILSTSSTGYASIALYGGIIALRVCALPGYLRADKIMIIACIGVVAALAGTVLALADPKFADEIHGILTKMTTGKLNSDSGRQRAFWAAIGYKAFLHSFGLGIGAGSFRSSSMVMAILGSMGVLGAAFFVAHGWYTLVGLRRLSRVGTPAQDRNMAIAQALGMTAVCGLLPQIISSPTPDPGMDFAILAGAALGMRRGLWKAEAPAVPATIVAESPAFTLAGPALPRSFGWRRNAR